MYKNIELLHLATVFLDSCIKSTKGEIWQKSKKLRLFQEYIG
jgi:hypothetical protein